MTTMHTLARRAAAGLAGWGLALAAQAHPGHGDHEALGVLATLLHPFELHHALWAAAALALAARASTGRRGNWLLLGAAAASGLALMARG